MLELLKKLIRAESTARTGELNAGRALADAFKKAGLPCQIDTWNTNRANFLAHIKSTGEKPALLFVAHLDVVPPGSEKWQYPPFDATETDNRIYGRGAADMKGPLAAAAAAIIETATQKNTLQGDIILLAAAGEETDSAGVKRFLADRTKNLPDLAGIVIPEPTDFKTVTAHRGILWLKLTTHGKTAHSSTPHLGRNAIYLMSPILAALQSAQIDHPPHPTLGPCTLSVNKITGGTAANVVPDFCSIQIDIRTLPDQDHKAIAETQIRPLLLPIARNTPHFNCDIETLRDVPALETDPQSAFVKDFCRAVAADKTHTVGWTTDGPHLAPLAAPTVVFGPGKPDLCHRPDEYIDIPDAQKAVHAYKSVLNSFLK